MAEQRIVRPERTQWRDGDISTRHRQYGWDCPAVDIDFLLLEYDTGKPSALVEYKRFGAQAVALNSPTYKAIRALADAANIPFLVVFYNPAAGWWYYAAPANAVAKQQIPARRYYSEREYVSLLYRLRGRTAPIELLNRLNNYTPGI